MYWVSPGKHEKHNDQGTVFYIVSMEVTSLMVV